MFQSQSSFWAQRISFDAALQQAELAFRLQYWDLAEAAYNIAATYGNYYDIAYAQNRITLCQTLKKYHSTKLITDFYLRGLHNNVWLNSQSLSMQINNINIHLRSCLRTLMALSPFQAVLNFSFRDEHSELKHYIAHYNTLFIQALLNQASQYFAAGQFRRAKTVYYSITRNAKCYDASEETVHYCLAQAQKCHARLLTFHQFKQILTQINACIQNGEQLSAPQFRLLNQSQTANTISYYFPRLDVNELVFPKNPIPYLSSLNLTELLAECERIQTEDSDLEVNFCNITQELIEESRHATNLSANNDYSQPFNAISYPLCFFKIKKAQDTSLPIDRAKLHVPAIA